MVKKRRIASKPTDSAAADWVAAGGADPETSKQADAQTSKADEKRPKSKDPGYLRTTMYLSKALHKRLKIASIGRDDGFDMSDIAEAAITDWLDKQPDV